MKKIQWHYSSSHPSDISFLLKYNPKYFQKLSFPSSSLQKQKVLSKFKSLKIVKTLDILDYMTDSRGLVISAFKSQRNCLKNLKIQDLMLVKYYPRLENFCLCSKILQSWRMFLRLNHLKTLTLECPYIRNPGSSSFAKGMGKIKNFYRRFWQHFSKLRFLKDFSVNLYNKLDSEVLNFLRKLDSLKDELGSLKKFSLFLSHLDVDSDVNLDFVNIYKHLTGFRIHESSFATTQKFLNNLESFKRLESLNVLKNMSHPGEENEVVNFSYFSKLEYLDRIENMDIAFNFGESLLNFLEYFAIPKSIISLKLSFYETNWTRILVSR